MATHLYRPLGARDRARIGARMEDCLRAWSELWFSAERARVEVIDWWEAAGSPAEGEWECCVADEDASAALALQAVQRGRLLDLLCGGDAESSATSLGADLAPLGSALVDACLRDLLTRLFAGGGDDSTASAPTGRCIAVAVALGPVAMRLSLSPERVLPSADATLPESAPALTPPAEACARQGVPAVAKMQGAELPLSAVATLRVGDVLRLDHALDEPCEVHFAGTGVVLSGFLGRRGDRRAVKVVGRENP